MMEGGEVTTLTETHRRRFHPSDEPGGGGEELLADYAAFSFLKDGCPPPPRSSFGYNSFHRCVFYDPGLEALESIFMTGEAR